MLSTSERLLRVLTLLESRRDWSGADLAERLEVSTRTIRNDMVRLRTLGYPVGAASAHAFGRAGRRGGCIWAVAGSSWPGAGTGGPGARSASTGSRSAGRTALVSHLESHPLKTVGSM